MDKRLDFRFSIPRPPEGPLVEMSAEEMERALLKRLEEEQGAPTNALWQLARFYQQCKQHEKGLTCLRQAMAHMPDVETFEFQDDVECCQKAVEVASQRLEESRPIVYRGWKKQAILWQGKLRRLRSKVRRLFAPRPGRS